MAHFHYCGTVRGQGRPRFRRNGNPYYKDEDKEYRKKLQAAYKEQDWTYFPKEVPLRVMILVYRALPKKDWRKTKKVSKPDIVKPDTDNIAKAVLDALNGLAWADDCQIVSLTVRKFNREQRNEDHLEVYIRETN